MSEWTEPAPPPTPLDTAACDDWPEGYGGDWCSWCRGACYCEAPDFGPDCESDLW